MHLHTDAKPWTVSDELGDLGPENWSDEALVERAVTGCARSLSLLLSRHQRYLFNVALRFLQSRPDAENATHEILLRIATRLSSFRSQGRFELGPTAWR